MLNQDLIKKYAKLIVNTGAKVKKGQIVDLYCSIENAEFGRMILEECYIAGAKQVIMNWVDDQTSVLAYKYAELETLKEIKPYVKSRYEYVAENKAVRIFLDDDDPNAFKDVDAQKMAEAGKDISSFVHSLFSKIEGEYQWCIAGIPSKKWANIVFPELTEEEAYDALWEQILKICRINTEDNPLELWEKHNKILKDRCEKLTNLDLEYLEYKNSLGTDLKVYLAENHEWKGGQDRTKDGTDFYPNLPTEEIFTTPHCNKVDGTLVSTMPLSYNGNTISGMKFTFKDGKVISYSATEGEEVLKHMLEMDENACRLGEVALVPFDNPIRKSNKLFYSTLFDENASCHFAFGRFYRDTIKNNENLSDEELEKLGCNNSIIHVDFMVGSEDLCIIGTKKNGEKIKIFENGNFVI